MEWLLCLIRCTVRAGQVFHLGHLEVEFGRRCNHALECLIEREACGILDEPLQPGDGDAKAMEAL